MELYDEESKKAIRNNYSRTFAGTSFMDAALACVDKYSLIMEPQVYREYSMIADKMEGIGKGAILSARDQELLSIAKKVRVAELFKIYPSLKKYEGCRVWREDETYQSSPNVVWDNIADIHWMFLVMNDGTSDIPEVLAEVRRYDIIQIFFGMLDPMYWNPALTLVSKQGNYTMVKFFLEQGCDVESVDPSFVNSPSSALLIKKYKGEVNPMLEEIVEEYLEVLNTFTLPELSQIIISYFGE